MRLVSPFVRLTLGAVLVAAGLSCADSPTGPAPELTPTGALLLSDSVFTKGAPVRAGVVVPEGFTLIPGSVKWTVASGAATVQGQGGALDSVTVVPTSAGALQLRAEYTVRGALAAVSTTIAGPRRRIVSDIVISGEQAVSVASPILAIPTTLNTNYVAGATISPVRVEIRDARGQVVSAATDSVTLTLDPATASGATLLGTLRAKAVAGVATFNGLSIRKAGTGYRLVATSAGAAGTPAVQTAIIAGAPNAAQSTIAVADSVRPAGTTTTVTVTLKDEYGNPVLTAGRDAFQATPSAGNVGLFTCNQGVCTAVYTVPTAVGTPTVAATIGGAPISRSPASVRVTAARAVKFIITGSAAQEAGAAQTVTVTAVDEFGNVVTDYAGDRLITFSGALASLTGVAPTAGTGPMQSAVTLRFVNGVATASMTLYRAETPTIDVTDGTIKSNGKADGGLEVTVSATKPDASQTTYTVSETTETVGGTVKVVVTVRDQYGNIVPDAKPTDFAVTPSAGTLGGFTCANGICEATYTAPTTPGTPTFTAKVGTTDVPAATPTSVTVSPGAPDATKSTLVIGDSVLTQGATTTATVTLRDLYGNIVTTAGPSAFAAVTSAGTLGTFTCASGVCTATVSATALATGAVTATIGDANIVGSPAPLRITGGPAARLKITGSDTTTAGAIKTITLTAFDANGNVAASYTGNKVLTFGGASVANATAPTISTVAFGTATPVSFTNGVASVPMRLYKAETAIVDATDGTIRAANADRLSVVVSAAAIDPSQSTLALSQTAVTVGGTLTAAVTLRDAWGNPVTTATKDDFTPGATPAGLGDFTCAAGVCTATYTAPLTPGTATITATVGSPATAITGSPASVAINPAVAAKLVITGSDTTTAGVAKTITVTARDSLGNVAGGYTGNKRLTFSGALAQLAGTVGPTVRDTAFASPTTLSFTNGVATAPMVLVRASTSAQVIAVTDGTISAAGSDRLGVVVSAAAASAATSTQAVSADSIDVGQTLTVTVTVKDAFGNPVPNATIPGSITTSVTPGVGSLGAFTCTAAGICTATYTPPTTSPATPTFTSRIGTAVVPADRTVKVGSAPAAFFRIVGANSTQTTTQSTDQSQAITITAVDTLGNVVPGFTGDKALTFAGANLAPDNSAPGIAIGAAGPFTWTAFGSATTVAFANGVSVNANLKVTKVETAQIAATATGITTPNANRLQVTVSEGAIDLGKSSFEVLDPTSLAPRTSVAVNGALTVRVTLRDRFGNPVTSATKDSFTPGLTGTGTLGTFSCTAGVCTAGYTAPGTTGNEVLSAKIGTADIGTAPTSSPKTIAVTSGTPSTFVITGTVTQVAGSTQVVSIEARDAQGSRAQNYTGVPKNLDFGPLTTSPNNTKPTINTSDVLTARPITFTNGVATINLVLVKAGITETVTASDPALGITTSAPLSVAVTPGAADAASSPLTLSANPVTVGTAVTATVTVKDALGNPVTSVPDPTVVVFSDTAAVGAFDRVSCTGNICTSLYTAPSAPQTVKVAAKLGGVTVLNSPVPLVVNTLGASRLKVELVTPFVAPADTAFVAGGARPVRIRALDGLGNTVTSFTGSVAVEFDQTTVGLAPDNSTYSGAPGSIPSDAKIANNLYPAGATLNFVAGAAEADLIIYKAGERATIKAKSAARSITNFSSITSDWQVIPVVAAAASPVRSTLQLVGASPVPPGAKRDVIVTLRDLYGNPISTTAGQAPPASAQLALALSPSSTGGTLAPLSTFVCNATGVCTGTEAYVAPAAPVNPVTITGSIGGTNFTQSPIAVTLSAGPAARLKITGAASQTAGVSQGITVTAYDASGNVADSYTGTKSLTFKGALAPLAGATVPSVNGQVFASVSGNYTATVDVTFSNGVSTSTPLILVRSGIQVLGANDAVQTTVATGVVGDSLAVTVSAAAANAGRSTVAALPTTLRYGGSPQPTSEVTVTLKDAFGNPVSDPTCAAFSSTVTNPTLGGFSFSGGACKATFTPSAAAATAGSATVAVTVGGVAVTPSAVITITQPTLVVKTGDAQTAVSPNEITERIRFTIQENGVDTPVTSRFTISSTAAGATFFDDELGTNPAASKTVTVTSGSSFDVWFRTSATAPGTAAIRAVRLDGDQVLETTYTLDVITATGSTRIGTPPVACEATTANNVKNDLTAASGSCATQGGELLMLVFGNDTDNGRVLTTWTFTNSTYTTASGLTGTWTRGTLPISDAGPLNDANQLRTQVWYTIVPGTAGSTQSVPAPAFNSPNKSRATYIVVRLKNGAAPAASGFRAEPTAGSGPTAGIDIPSATAAQNGSTILAFAVQNIGGTSYTTPAGLGLVAQTNNGGQYITMVVFSKDRTFAGATPSFSVGTSQTTNAAVAGVLVFNPPTP